MKHSLLRLAFAGLLCISAPALSGCGGFLQSVTGPPSTTTVNSVAAAETSYTATAKLATAYLRSGKATPAQAQAIAQADRTAYAAIVAARDAVKQGSSPALSAAMVTINQALLAFAGSVPNTGGTP